MAMIRESETDAMQRMTDRSNAGAGAGLTLALFMPEVMNDCIVIARFYQLVRIEIIAEQNADSFAPRVTTDSIDYPISMSARLLKTHFTRFMHILYKAQIS